MDRLLYGPPTTPHANLTAASGLHPKIIPDMSKSIYLLFIFMPPFEKGGAYCFAPVGRYVGMSVGMSVGRSVCR